MSDKNLTDIVNMITEVLENIDSDIYDLGSKAKAVDYSGGDSSKYNITASYIRKHGGNISRVRGKIINMIGIRDD